MLNVFITHSIIQFFGRLIKCININFNDGNTALWTLRFLKKSLFDRHEQKKFDAERQIGNGRGSMHHYRDDYGPMGDNFGPSTQFISKGWSLD